MSTRTWTSTVVAGLLAIAHPLAAQEVEPPVTFSGSATFVNDYTFRGISQTSEGSAVQAGVDAALGSAAYVGLWGSSLDFGEAAAAGRATAELDIFGGVALHQFLERLGKVARNWPRYSRTNHTAVNLGHGNHLCRGACQKHFIGGVEIVSGQVHVL